MRNNIISKRYAAAFMEFAEPKIGLARCLDDMKSLKWLLRENPEFGRLLKAPELPYSDKFRLVDKVFGVDYSKETCIFLKHLIMKNRIASLVDIADYIRLVYSHSESEEVLLRTTFPLELELIQKIKDRLQKKIGKGIVLHLELDPDLLGGVQMVMGNTVIDGSVRNSMKELKKQLLKT